jgi:SAM-dependent methyltransferase
MTIDEPSPHPTPQRLMQFGSGYAPPLIIKAALDVGVFDALAGSPKSLDQLHSETGASLRGLRAILNALVGLELLAKSAEGQFRLTPESATYLVSSAPGFYGGIFRHATRQLIPKWMNLTEIVRTGRPAAAVNNEEEGGAYFQQFVADIFPTSYPAAQALGRALGIAGSTDTLRVLDIGAGSGVWGIAIAQQSPHVRVTAVDWPAVLTVTRQMTERFGVAERFEFVAGNMQEADFGAGYQVALLGQILHSEGEIRSRRLLGRVFDALAPGGTIAIGEFVPNADRTGPVGPLIFAVNMLVNTDDGDTFTFEEMSAWLGEAGFTNCRQLDAPGPSPITIATRAVD